MSPKRAHQIRTPTATVLRNFGAPCPVGYQVGESIPLGALQENAFRCKGANEALEPFLDLLKTSEYVDPDCSFRFSCDCPLADSELVFFLYTLPGSV